MSWQLHDERPATAGQGCFSIRHSLEHTCSPNIGDNASWVRRQAPENPGPDSISLAYIDVEVMRNNSKVGLRWIYCTEDLLPHPGTYGRRLVMLCYPTRLGCRVPRPLDLKTARQKIYSDSTRADISAAVLEIREKTRVWGRTRSSVPARRSRYPRTFHG
jgi:hypothetical protein